MFAFVVYNLSWHRSRTTLCIGTICAATFPSDFSTSKHTLKVTSRHSVPNGLSCQTFTQFQGCIVILICKQRNLVFDIKQTNPSVQKKCRTRNFCGHEEDMTISYFLSLSIPPVPRRNGNTFPTQGN